jgi:4-aminobutyrate aminotransferase
MTLDLPGPKSQKILDRLNKLNIAHYDPYPLVMSQHGSGCYFQDIDGNLFLDFASQICSNPLGYNDPELKEVIKRYSYRFPIKFAGQDFSVKEHLDLLEELMKIAPKGLNMAFLVNSGAEAVENCLKLAMRKQKNSEFGVAFEHAFHGRTLGALSCTSSRLIQKQNFLQIPIKKLPYDDNALDVLQNLINTTKDTSHIGFVIIEPIQGEGGYTIASRELMKGLRKITKQNDIPFICDEVQTGMGRTGTWWASEQYGINPDLISAAKALQVGAAIANKSYRPQAGTISSTWGGGHALDMAIGLKTIEIIKKRKLLDNVRKQGIYLLKRLYEVRHISNVRGMGLMIAFDLPNKTRRNHFIIECLKNGLVLLGCGEASVRVIPPYIVTEEEIDRAVEIIQSVALKVSDPAFKHTGKICQYLTCGEVNA